MKLLINNQKISLIEANTFKIRLIGFTFKKSINYGLFLPKCNNIHTFFMKQNIDVIMTDKNHKIIYLKKSVKKNRIIYKRKAYNTIELPNNSIYELKIGDYLRIET